MLTFNDKAGKPQSWTAPNWGPGNPYPQQAQPQSAPKPPSMPLYQQGQAQPRQQSFGTPYDPQSSGSVNMSAWGRPQPTSQTFGAPRQPTVSVTNQQSAFGNMGNTQTGRPQPFQANYYDLQGNPTSFEQQQAQRAAMVEQMRQAELPYVLANSFNKNLGPQQYDFNSMLEGANKAVENGYYNPFQRYFQEQDMMQRIAQQGPPQMYQTGGQGMPAPPPEPDQFVDARGRKFLGTQSFAPGTPDSYREAAYERFANENGHYRQPAGYGSRIGREGQFHTADWQDSDQDGIDDRWQLGPWAPNPKRNAAQPYNGRSASGLIKERYDAPPIPADYVNNYRNLESVRQLYLPAGGAPDPERGRAGQLEPQVLASNPGLSRPVGQRTMFIGDMGLSERHMGTEAFERAVREEMARPAPPFMPRPPSGVQGGNAPLPIQPPSQGTPYGMREKPAPQQPKKDPGQEFNEQLRKRAANLEQARREGKVLDVNGNFISPKNLPPDLYADWLKTGRPQY